MNRDDAVSRNYIRGYFPEELNIDHKITIFSDRVKGWQLSPAKEIAESNPHYGFIVLYAITHYFEAIGKFISGYINDRGSFEFFNVGFRDTAPFLGIKIMDLPDNSVKTIYQKIRNSLYHTGLTGPGIALTGDINVAIKLDGTRVIVSPRQLVICLESHFNAYIERLKNSNETSLRQNFEKRFNHLYGESMKLES